MVYSLERTFKERGKKISELQVVEGINKMQQVSTRKCTTANTFTGCLTQHWGGSCKTALSRKVQEFVYTMSGPAQSLQEVSQCSQFWYKHKQGRPACL